MLKISFFQNYQIALESKPRPAPRERQASENPAPGATRLYNSPAVARGQEAGDREQGRSCLELTETFKI